MAIAKLFASHANTVKIDSLTATFQTSVNLFDFFVSWFFPGFYIFCTLFISYSEKSHFNRKSSTRLNQKAMKSSLKECIT